MIYTSDYPIDKVVFKRAGSYFMPQMQFMSDSRTISFPHGLGYAPLAIGMFSDSSNFSTFWELGSAPQFFNSFFQSWGDRINVVAESDATNIYLSFINWDTSRNIYYRIVAYAPSTDVEHTTVVTPRDRLYLNTDYNYMKIHQEQIQTHNMGDFQDYTATLNHNLGYIPTAMVFTEFDGRIRRSGFENLIGVNPVSSQTTLTTTQTRVLLQSVAPTTVRVHYRVYRDD